MTLTPNPVLEGLLKRRAIALDGDINHELTDSVGHKMLELQLESSEPIDLIIDSGGGSDSAAFKLCDFMSHILVAPVRGITFGECSSAATFVMLHCTERWGTPNSRYLIHSGRADVSLTVSQSTAAKVEELLRDLKRDEERVIKMYMAKLKKSRKEILRLIARGDQSFDQHLSAEEALEIGLINRIVEGKLDIFK